MFAILLLAHSILCETKYCLPKEGETCTEGTQIESFSEIYENISEIDSYIFTIHRDRQANTIFNTSFISQSAKYTFVGETGSYVKIWIPAREITVTGLTFDSIEVDLYESMPEAAIKVTNLFTASKVIFFGDADISCKRMDTDLMSITNLVHLTADNIFIDCSSDRLMTHSFSFNPALQIPKIEFFNIEEDCDATIIGSSIELNFGYYYANFTNGEFTVRHKFAGFKFNVELKEVNKNSKSFHLFVSNLAPVSIGGADSTIQPFEIDVTDGAEITFNKDSKITKLTAHSGPVRLVSSVELFIGDIYLYDTTKLYLETTSQITSTALWLNGSPNMMSMDDMVLALERLHINNVTYSTDFGQNIKFKVNKYFEADDVDFTFPNLDIDATASIIFTVDYTPRKGFVIENDFKMPTSRVSLKLKDATVTPSNEDMKELVENPTYIFCAEDLECDNSTLYLGNSANVHGFTQSRSLVKPVCEVPDWDKQKKCFGFRVTDYPANVYPNLCFTKGQHECPSGFAPIDIDDGINLNRYIKSSAVEAFATVIAPMDTTNPIDLTTADHPMSWIFNTEGSGSNIPLVFSSSMNRAVNDITFQSGNLVPIVEGRNPDIAINSLSFGQHVTIQNRILVDLENVKLLDIPFELFDKFDLSGVDHCNFTFYTLKIDTIKMVKGAYHIEGATAQYVLPISGDSEYWFNFRNALTVTRMEDDYTPIHLFGWSYDLTFDNTWNEAHGEIAIIAHNTWPSWIHVSGDYVPMQFLEPSTFGFENKGIATQVYLAPQTVKSLGVSFRSNSNFSFIMSKPKIGDRSSFFAYQLSKNMATFVIESPTILDNATVSFDKVTIKGKMKVGAKAKVNLKKVDIKDAEISLNMGANNYSSINFDEQIDQLPISYTVSWTPSLKLDEDVVIGETTSKEFLEYDQIIKFDPTEASIDGRSIKPSVRIESNKLVAHFEISGGSGSGKAGLIAGVTIGCIAGIALVGGLVFYLFYVKKISFTCKKGGLLSSNGEGDYANV